MILEGKTVVVSGVGPGLGREIAVCALRDGARVAIAARTESKLTEIAKRLDPTGERVLACASDVTDAARCEALMQATADRFGGVDAVVNVAALDALFGTLESTSQEDWRRSMEMNVIGTMNVAKAAVPHLEASGGGAARRSPRRGARARRRPPGRRLWKVPRTPAERTPVAPLRPPARPPRPKTTAS